jgi:hypothetical protein
MRNATSNNNNNYNSNSNNVDTSALNKEGRELDAKYLALKKMATARKIDNSYHKDEKGSRVYNDKEAERQNNILLASARPMKSEAEILKENQLIRSEAERQNNHHYNSSSVSCNTSSSSSSPSVKNVDQPFSVYLANRALNADYAAGLNLNKNQNQKLNSGQSVNMAQPSDSNNNNTYSDDGIMISHILNDLRKNVLSTGVEYDSASLTSLIKARYPNVTPSIIKAVLNLIFSDVENMKSKVAGTFPGFRLLISSRKPTYENQQLIHQQQIIPPSQKPPTNNNQQTTNVKVPPAVQARIDALSPSDKQILSTTAQSVVNELLPQITDPVDSKDLENQITAKYNISADLAALLVSILLLYSEYATKIKSPDQSNQQQQQQQNQQPLQQQQPNNINSVSSQNAKFKPTSTRPSMNNTNTDTSTTEAGQTDQQSNNNNNLGKQGFANYKNMNSCLTDQTVNHGLSHDVAISTCSKMLQMHVKNQQQSSQQPGQQLQQKAASVENQRDEWQKLRAIIIQSPRS